VIWRKREIMNKNLIKTVESLGGTALMGGILIQFSDTTFAEAVKKIYEMGVEAERESIQKTLAKSKQEPVGWAEHGVINWLADRQFNHTSFLYDTPAQRTWVGLTDDEILLISADCAASHQHTDIHFARAIEAKLRSKND